MSVAMVLSPYKGSGAQEAVIERWKAIDPVPLFKPDSWRSFVNSAEMRELVDRYIDAYNRMDIDQMLLALHPEVEFKNISGGMVNASTHGIEELKALAEQSLSLFSERHQEILSFESSGSRAIASVAFRAVVAGDLPNGLRNSEILSISGRSEFEFRDGAISRITDIS